ncbi:Trigger factor [termite gut metagenome]|uniref:Trigger factor n=1 Tax=termite gut metagenome TaxID=433724 RepID=A0A5J4QUQ7_9ZZZZ
MNLSLQNIDNVSATLTVKVEKADYQAQIDKSLKTLRQKVQMPGFRKGMVPINLVKKLYGKSVVAEEVNKLLSEKVYGYIKENNIKILGEPLPNENEQQDLDFDIMEEFEFLFDIAIAPEVKVDISSENEIDIYTIETTDETVEEQVKTYADRYGNYANVQSYQDKDMLKGLITELDENGNAKEGGIRVEAAVLMPAYMKDEEQKNLFADAKVNDVIVFNPNKAYDGHDTEIASLLKIESNLAGEIKSDFSFQIEEITRYSPSDLNQELFDKIYGENVVSTEEEFRAKVKDETIARNLIESDYKFLIDLQKMLLEKTGNNMEFSEKLLKRIFLFNVKDKSKEEAEEYVNEHYDESIRAIKWQLIKGQLAKDNNIGVEEEDILNMAKQNAKIQFAQYGMTNISDDIATNYANEMMKKQETVNSLVDRVIENKLVAILKSQLKINNKTVSSEEFYKLIE